MLARRLRCLIGRTQKHEDRHLFDLCLNSKFNNRYDNDAAWENVRHWFTNDFARVKQTATYQDKVNLMTPLHLILSGEGRGRYPPIDIVEIFINYAPEAVKIRDAKGRLPIHMAYQYGHLLDAMRILLEAYPKSIFVMDNEGWLPIQYACWWSGSFQALNPLLQADPESIDYPESTLVVYNNGDVPLISTSFNRAAAHKDERGMLLLHHLAGYDKFTEDLFIFLFGSYPEAIAVPDNHGLLPFHHACISAASSVETLMLFLKRYPASLVFV